MTDLPDIRIKALISYPANIIGGAGIAVKKENGAVTIDLAHGEFPVISAVPTSPTNAILTYDTVSGQYANIPTDLLGGAVAGISDAPVDSVLYGRLNAEWVPAAPIASPAFTGNPTAPTPSSSDHDTSIATTAFVSAAIAALPPPPSSGSIASPQGRLTLTSGTPVMTTSVAASSIVYYTPACGNQVPVYNGTSLVSTMFSEISQLLTDATKSPAAVAANSVYDLFVWNDAGTIRCTRGPAWASATTRSAGTALVSVNGILLNSVPVTNGPAAQRGTYVGSIASNASSTVDYIYGAPGAGGVAAALNVWNAYNRVSVATNVTDTGASYSYSASAIRQARGSAGNQISFVVGLAEDGVSVSYNSTFRALAGVSGTIAITSISLDSVSAFNTFPQTISPAWSAAVAFYSGNNSGLIPATSIGIGSHFVAALEQTDGTNAVTFDAISGNVLGAMLRM